jgi:hypothetical protein
MTSCSHDIDCLRIVPSVEGQLHRNGWAFAGDRFLRMPSSFVASTVEAVQLNVTVTQQQQVTININVQSVKFQPIAGGNADLENLNVVERAVSLEKQNEALTEPSRSGMIHLFRLFDRSRLFSGEDPAGCQGWHDHSSARDCHDDQFEIARR